jgi:uncharacterized membrane-anchored protein YitT (DUF2179 family)
MSLLHSLLILLQAEETVLGSATCPNCGLTQPSSENEEFHCLQCGYRVPHIIRRPRPALAVPSTIPWNTLLEVLFLFLGPLCAVIGLKGFLLPNGLIDGGVTGVSMLLSRVLGIELAVFVVAINIPFLYMAWSHFQRGFALRAGFSIVLLAVILPFLPVPLITHDRLLDAVFGGSFLGAGIAFSIRGGGVLDGTEILALLISRRFPATVGDAILFFNVIIFGSALAVLPPEQVLYSILTYFSASKTVDFMMHGIESLNGVLIFSSQSPQIRMDLVNRLERGVTLLKAKGGYSDRDQEVLFCVLSRLEISTMRRMVEEIDGGAFVVVFPISDARGGTIRKVLHEKKILPATGA